MGESSTDAYQTANCQKEMALDWTYSEKASKMYCKTGSEVESPRFKKQEAAKRDLEEVCGERNGAKGLTWGELATTAQDRQRWKLLVSDLSSFTE